MATSPENPTYALRLITGKLIRILEVFFEGGFIAESPALNDIYILLRERARQLAEPYRSAEESLEAFLSVFPNLYESVEDPLVPEVRWEFEQDVVKQLKSETAELHVASLLHGSDISKADEQLMQSASEIIDKYVAEKKKMVQAFLARAEAAGKRFQEQMVAAASSHQGEKSQQPKRGLEDEAHAACIESLIGMLKKEGHDPRPEGTYSHFGERGSVDVYYLEPPYPKRGDSPTGLAIFEVWTQIKNLNEALRKLDEKARVFPAALAQQVDMNRPPLMSAHFVLLATQENVKLIRGFLSTFTNKFNASLSSGQRFELQLFDPVSKQILTLLPREQINELPALLSRWDRFPSISAFLKAWHARQSNP